MIINLVKNIGVVLLLLTHTYLTIPAVAFRTRPPGNQTTTELPPGNFTIEERIVGGSFAGDSQVPHQAVIIRNGNPFCGGSLIKRNYVLTAAHCVLENGGRGGRVPVFQLTVKVGTVNLQAGGQIIPIAELKVHPNYRFLVFDLALMRLARDVQFSRVIRLINPGRVMPPPGTQLMVSGFGATRTGGGMNSRLLFTIVTVQNDRDCFRRVRSSPSVFCATHPQGRGICQGDSGGPAFIGNTLFGVTSFTVGGCGTTNPDGFAKVPNMAQWVLDNSR